MTRPSASLRREEGYVPRLSLAFAAPEAVNGWRFPAGSLATSDHPSDPWCAPFDNENCFVVDEVLFATVPQVTIPSHGVL